MNKSLISLSFDDGRIDSYTVALPILKRYNLSATFNITTGYVIDKQKYGSPADVAPMTVDMVRAIYADKKYEIAGHGLRHLNDETDIVQGLTELKSLLGTDSLTPMGDGFASPGTGLSQTVWHKIHDVEGKFVYARLSLRYLSHPQIKAFVRKVSRVLSLPYFYSLAYRDTLMESVDNGLIYSIPVLSAISVNELKAVVQYAEKNKKACTLMFHSIVDDGKEHDNWDFSKSKFEALCAFLAHEISGGALDACTTMNLYQEMTNK